MISESESDHNNEEPPCQSAHRGRSRGRGQAHSRQRRGPPVNHVPSAAECTAASGIVWNTEPVREDARGRRAARNIFTPGIGGVGPQGDAKKVASETDAFELYLSDDILSKVLTHTNEEGKRILESGDTFHGFTLTNYTVTMTELKAYFGLCAYRGARGLSNFTIKELFSKIDGIGMFYGTMSIHRFEFITSILRFENRQLVEKTKNGTKNNDNPDEWEIQPDKFIHVRTIFLWFVRNCKKYFNVGEQATIDEMLRAFRGHCPFRVYMKSKPAKYGILFRIISDAAVRYTYDILPYIGAEIGNPDCNKPYEIVKNLTKDLVNSGRNITADRWYGSYPLAEYLYTKRLTYLGTMNRRRRNLPPFITSKYRRPAAHSRFLYHSKTMLCSYKPKKTGNPVVMISTMHDRPDIPTEIPNKPGKKNESNKPQIIYDYNENKAGVDAIDQCVGLYSSYKPSKKWPHLVWSVMVDIALLNGYVVYLWKNPKYNSGDPKYSIRKTFIKAAVMPWIRHHVEERARLVQCGQLPLNSHHLAAMSSILGRDVKYVPLQPPPSCSSKKTKRSRCHLCKDECNGSTTNLQSVPFQCSVCREHVCNKPIHVRIDRVCMSCTTSIHID